MRVVWNGKKNNIAETIDQYVCLGIIECKFYVEHT